MNKELAHAQLMLDVLESHKRLAEHSKERIPLKEIKRSISYWRELIKKLEQTDIPDYNQD